MVSQTVQEEEEGRRRFRRVGEGEVDVEVGFEVGEVCFGGDFRSRHGGCWSPVLWLCKRSGVLGNVKKVVVGLEVFVFVFVM